MKTGSSIKKFLLFAILIYALGALFLTSSFAMGRKPKSVDKELLDEGAYQVAGRGRGLRRGTDLVDAEQPVGFSESLDEQRKREYEEYYTEPIENNKLI